MTNEWSNLAIASASIAEIDPRERQERPGLLSFWFSCGPIGVLPTNFSVGPSAIAECEVTVDKLHSHRSLADR